MGRGWLAGCNNFVTCVFGFLLHQFAFEGDHGFDIDSVSRTRDFELLNRAKLVWEELYKGQAKREGTGMALFASFDVL